MIIKKIEIEKFRAFKNASFYLGKRITAISGRNATQKTTLLGMLGQPFTISNTHPMYGCKTIDGYNFRSQFREKFKISPAHDRIGDHKWNLVLHNNIFPINNYRVESIARRQGAQTPTLRFWNAESRDRGAGYLQAPVYFLSLSRLFPIGETGKTQSMPPELSPEELTYCITKYREILSIQQVPGVPSIELEKGASSKTFSGVSDGVHDVFTNSAGEGNITRIILAVLSFKRLLETYPRDYKGGILLIDELDATLYGFSQRKLVDFLWEAAGTYKIQIVFTTHSPIILKHVNRHQRDERRRLGIDLPLFAYDSAIVYLDTHYSEEGTRVIMPKDIFTTDEMNVKLNDINLIAPTTGSKINVYCEDARAISFARHVLSRALGNINLDLYMRFIDINLGWSNYVQLYEKSVPEFRNSIILLDHDVLHMPEYRPKQRVIAAAGNILFLPLAIERGLFEFLKNHGAFNQFYDSYSNVPAFNYDLCFCDWPLEVDRYQTIDFKKWFTHTEQILGDQSVLFDFWYDNNMQAVSDFVEEFKNAFNTLAERNEVDPLPTTPVDNVVFENQTE